jgi:hypothetical protein
VALEYLLPIGVALVAVFVVLLTLYVTRARGRKKRTVEPLKEMPEINEKLPLKVGRSVTTHDAKRAQEELRLLDLEREIHSFAIRRLYEAQAEGKINEEEREHLATGYKERMRKIKETISRSESVVALHELEAMQEDLVKLFSDRFDEINMKIEGLRSNLDFKPIREVPIPSPVSPEKEGKEEKVKRKVRKPSGPKKTEAEKRIEEIRAEVEKVLERLGQIEVEA